MLLLESLSWLVAGKEAELDVPFEPPATRNFAMRRTMPKTSCEASSWKPFCRRDTSRRARRDPLAVRICCLPLPRKSPEMASCVADGCLTVRAYSDMEEKVVMLGGGGRRPRALRDAEVWCGGRGGGGRGAAGPE